MLLLLFSQVDIIVQVTLCRVYLVEAADTICQISRDRVSLSRWPLTATSPPTQMPIRRSHPHIAIAIDSWSVFFPLFLFRARLQTS